MPHIVTGDDIEHTYHAHAYQNTYEKITVKEAVS